MLCIASELIVPEPHSSDSPHRKVGNHSCFPGFHENFVFSQPGTYCFYLRQVTEFQNFKFSRLLKCRPALFPLGERGVSPCFFLSLGLCQENGHKTVQMFSLWHPRAESLHLDSLFAAGFPTLVSWKSATLRQPLFFLWPQGPWDHRVPPGILPCFAKRAPLIQGHSPL